MKYLVFIGISLNLMACAHSFKGDQNSLGNPVYYAKAKFPKQGTLMFSEAFGKVKIMGQLSGLAKNAQHGISIYEFGDCTNTGERYRGMDDEKTTAIGRIGNIQTNKSGASNVELEVEKLSINTGRYPIVGRSIVIHQHKDDMISKGHGGAGKAIACAVIGASSQ